MNEPVDSHLQWIFRRESRFEQCQVYFIPIIDWWGIRINISWENFFFFLVQYIRQTIFEVFVAHNISFSLMQKLQVWYLFLGDSLCLSQLWWLSHKDFGEHQCVEDLLPFLLPKENCIIEWLLFCMRTRTFLFVEWFKKNGF